MKIERKTLFVLLLCGALLIFAAGLAIYEISQPIPPALAEPSEDEEEEAAPVVTIELAAVGDNLMHMPLINSGQRDGFDKFYENIAPHLDGIDLCIVNQETVFVPDGFSGYPTFGGPADIGDALIGAGFNVIQQASNHSYDKGESGLRYTMDYWRAKPVTLLGVNYDPEDALRVDKFTKDDFTVALMNYTYGLNGFSLPKDKDYLVNLLLEDGREALAEKIALAKAESDLLIMLVHWGTEYSTVPDKYQQDWLKFFNENGVDVVIGTHPHVLQPCETYVGESGYKTVVFYSLGNFISNQDSIEKELGGMARVTLIKDELGARVEGYSLLPCFTHVSDGSYTVYSLDDYTDELAGRHSKYGGALTVQKIWDKFHEITDTEEGAEAPSSFII